jgi:type I restriction enzyme S subunit
MAGEWAPIRLGDVCTKVGSGATPRGGSDVYLEQGPYALIRSQNVYNDGFHRDGLAYIGEKHAAELDGVEVVKNDVLLNITGDSVARACQVDPGVLPARVNQHVAIIRPDPDKLDPRFLRYVLVSPEIQAKLLSWAGSGGTRHALTKGMIESFEVLAPEDIDEQRAIAHILGTLDDKIELNRRMNETLEAMARALFKSWFVDFDPVRAKAEGRDPGLPKPLADLFPDSFEDSELGEIPKGWGVKPFAETVEIIGGGTPKTSVPDYWNGEIPWFSVVDAPSESDVWVLDTEKKITQAGIENSSTQILPVGTTIISARGTVGRVALVGVPMAMNQSCYGLRGKMDSNGFYTFFATRELVARFQQHAHGSVFDTITRNTLAGISMVAPAAPLVEKFEKQVAPSLQRVRAGLLETRTLAALRDALLPRLISGELRVKDEEKFVARAVS